MLPWPVVGPLHSTVSTTEKFLGMDWLSKAKTALSAAQTEVESRIRASQHGKKPPPVVHSGNRPGVPAVPVASSVSLPRLKELPHLRTAWSVDEAVMEDSNKLVLIRYGRVI